MLNMGLYTDVDSRLSYHTRDFILVFLYQIYMFMVQIILLNMLIALMAESNDRVRSIAKLVAQFERAKLILQWERRLTNMPHSHSHSARLFRFFSGLPSGKGKRAAERIFPKWLHVLVPADHKNKNQAGGKTGDALAEEALKVAHKSFARAEERHQKLSRALRTNNEETKRLTTLLVETQEKHSNLLRDIARDVSSNRGRTNRIGDFMRDRARDWSRSPSASNESTSRGTSEVPPQAPPQPKPGGGAGAAQQQQQQPSKGWLAGLFNAQTVEESEGANAGSSRQQTADSKRRVSLQHPPAVRLNDPPLPGKGAGTAVSASAASPKAPAAGPMVPSIGVQVADLQKKALKVPIPDPLPRAKPSPANPSKVVKEMLSKCKPVNLDVAHRIASSIRDPAYDLRQYHADIQEAFPELRLYFVEPPERSGKKATKRGAASAELTTSGIDGESEYLRTVGAFFAVYWLMRIGIDGERGEQILGTAMPNACSLDTSLLCILPFALTPHTSLHSLLPCYLPCHSLSPRTSCYPRTPSQAFRLASTKRLGRPSRERPSPAKTARTLPRRASAAPAPRAWTRRRSSSPWDRPSARSPSTSTRAGISCSPSWWRLSCSCRARLR